MLSGGAADRAQGLIQRARTQSDRYERAVKSSPAFSISDEAMSAEQHGEQLKKYRAPLRGGQT
jgi:hypothetical protein